MQDGLSVRITIIDVAIIFVDEINSKHIYYI